MSIVFVDHLFFYHSFLKNLLIVPLELKCFLEIQISGSQRYSEIDPAHIWQDGIFGQGLQCHTSILFLKKEENNFNKEYLAYTIFGHTNVLYLLYLPYF